MQENVWYISFHLPFFSSSVYKMFALGWPFILGWQESCLSKSYSEKGIIICVADSNLCSEPNLSLFSHLCLLIKDWQSLISPSKCLNISKNPSGFKKHILSSWKTMSFHPNLRNFSPQITLKSTEEGTMQEEIVNSPPSKIDAFAQIT